MRHKKRPVNHNSINPIIRHIYFSSLSFTDLFLILKLSYNEKIDARKIVLIIRIIVAFIKYFVVFILIPFVLRQRRRYWADFLPVVHNY